MLARFTRLIALPLVIAAGAYAVWIRPWQQRWGATAEEMERDLPGDEHTPGAKYRTTHAISINAPANAVWPWLVQIGQGRGGFYSYDWLENLLDLDIHSADRIVPELQTLKAGDVISLAPENQLAMTVITLEPEQALVLRTGMPDAPVEPGDYLKNEIAGTWAFIIEPLDGQTTRLIVRWRSDWQASPLASLLNLVMLEPAHFIMERKMLLGIKERAERYASQASTITAAS